MALRQVRRAGELACEIPVVISNHPDLEHVATQFGIPFRCLPLDKAAGGKPAQEAAIDQLLAEHRIDTIVLARYMQVGARPASQAANSPPTRGRNYIAQSTVSTFRTTCLGTPTPGQPAS